MFAQLRNTVAKVRLIATLACEQASNQSPQDSLTSDCLRDSNDDDFCIFENKLFLARDISSEIFTSVHGPTPGELSCVEEDVEDSGFVVLGEKVEDILGEIDVRLAASERIDTSNTRTTMRLDEELRYVRETGTLSANLQASLRPSSPNGRRKQVIDMAMVNETFQSLFDKLYPFRSQQTGVTLSNVSSAPEASLSHADALYRLLSDEKCSCKANERSALLQLSDLSAHYDQTTFHMYLSCCPTQKKGVGMRNFHSAVCKFDNRKLKPSSDSFNICDNIEQSQRLQRKLHLSFNQSRLWPAKSSWLDNNVLPAEPPRKISLEDLLENGDLKPIHSADDQIRRFRLALGLASSLQYLCLGPWVQENWTVANIHVLQDEDPVKQPSSKLDGSFYVSCAFSTKGKSRELLGVPLQNTISEHPPDFFVHFAQLLLDIFKGEPSCSGKIKQDPSALTDSLIAEVRKSLQETLMDSYGKAIIGCLAYSYDLRTAMQDETDTRSCVQRVIRDSIVAPLRENLNAWERKGLSSSHYSLTSDSQKPLSSTFISESSGSTGNRRYELGKVRSTILSEHRLFFDRDNHDSIPPIEEPRYVEGDFTPHMKSFIEQYIRRDSPEQASKRVRVAILDTGFYLDEEDDFELLGLTSGGRIVLQKNFTTFNSEDCTDRNSHGTHVARLLLRHAPEAEICVAKISESGTLKETTMKQLSQALKWAGEHADIINLSFGLGPTSPLAAGDVNLNQDLTDLVNKGKLLFAAASNSGRNGGRSWPASHSGVFCIHATDQKGVSTLLNPTAMDTLDNFATLGHEVESYWQTNRRCISGTSFATPIAAAIAANVIEFARRHLSDANPELFLVYRSMRTLFSDHMCDNGKSSGNYHYLKPWRTGLWEEGADTKTSIARMKEKLKEIAVGSYDSTNKNRQLAKFPI